MSDIQHTPGPWVVTRRHVVGPVVDSDDQSNGMVAGVCDVYGDNRNQDARLIAAAPDLFEVVRSFIAHYPVGTNPFLDAAYNNGRRAIAKAEGRS